MKVLKNLLVVFTLLLSVILLVACGDTTAKQAGGSESSSSSTTGTQGSQTSSTDRPVDGIVEKQLAFWAPFGKEVQNALQPFIDKFNKQQKADIEAYNQANPNSKKSTYYTFNLVPQQGYDAVNTNLVTASSSGNLPKLVMGYPDTFALYNSGRKNQLLKLDDFIKNPALGGFTEEEYNDLNQTLIQEGTKYPVPGLWSLPVVKSTEFLYINKTIFDAASIDPTSIQSIQDFFNDKDKLIAASKTVLPADSVSNFKTVLAFDSTANLFITALSQLEQPYTEVSGKNGDVAFVNTVTQDGKTTYQPKDYVTNVMRYYKELYDNQVIATKKELNVRFTSQDFLQGHIFATIGSSAGLKYNNPYLSTAKKYTGNFDLEILPVPYLVQDALNDKSILQGPSITVFKDTSVDDQTKSDANIAAMRFIHMLLSPEAQEAYIVASPGYLPVNNKTFEQPKIKAIIANVNSSNKNDALLAKVYKMLDERKETFFLTNVFKKSALIRNKVDGILNPLFVNTDLKDIYKGVTPSMDASDTPAEKNAKVDKVIDEVIQKTIDEINFNK